MNFGLKNTCVQHPSFKIAPALGVQGDGDVSQGAASPGPGDRGRPLHFRELETSGGVRGAESWDWPVKWSRGAHAHAEPMRDEMIEVTRCVEVCTHERRANDRRDGW